MSPTVVRLHSQEEEEEDSCVEALYYQAKSQMKVVVCKIPMRVLVCYLI